MCFPSSCWPPTSMRHPPRTHRSKTQTHSAQNDGEQPHEILSVSKLRPQTHTVTSYSGGCYHSKGTQAAEWRHEPWHTAGMGGKCAAAAVGTTQRLLHTVGAERPQDTQTPPPGSYPQNRSRSQTCTPMFTAALSATSKGGSHPSVTWWVNEGINRTGSRHTTQCHSLPAGKGVFVTMPQTPCQPPSKVAQPASPLHPALHLAPSMGYPSGVHRAAANKKAPAFGDLPMARVYVTLG